MCIAVDLCGLGPLDSLAWQCNSIRPGGRRLNLSFFVRATPVLTGAPVKREHRTPSIAVGFAEHTAYSYPTFNGNAAEPAKRPPPEEAHRLQVSPASIPSAPKRPTTVNSSAGATKHLARLLGAPHGVYFHSRQTRFENSMHSQTQRATSDCAACQVSTLLTARRHRLPRLHCQSALSPSDRCACPLLHRTPCPRSRPL